MAKDRRFTLVVDRGEEKTLAVLAQLLRRSRSDVVRILIADEAERRNIVVHQDAATTRTCQSRQGISEPVFKGGQASQAAFAREQIG